MNKDLLRKLMFEIHKNDSIEDSDKQRYLLMLSALDDDDEDDMFVSSVQEANQLLLQHSGSSDAPYRRRLIDYITDPEHGVFASCDVYHNFLMDMFRQGEYFLALKVCDYVLTLAPQNRDILGDALKACGESCQFDRGDHYIRIAQTIPTSNWSYRLFLYCIDFLSEKLNAYPGDVETYEQAKALAKEFIKYFPYDEHGYNQYAELLITMNKRDEAVADLKRSIMEIQPDPNNRRSALICAQCCLTLLNLLDDSNDYNHIISVCDTGLRHTTQEQPSANVGYFMYRKALALDAKAHQEEFRAPDTLIQAMNCYQTAYDLNQDRSYARTIEKRFAILKPHAAQHGYTAPLMKRPLFVEQAEED